MTSLNNTTMTIRVNDVTKRQAQSLFADLGMDMSTAINVFLKRAIKEERIPFEVGRLEKPNCKTRAAISRIEKNKDLVGPFDSVEKAMEYLDS